MAAGRASLPAGGAPPAAAHGVTHHGPPGTTLVNETHLNTTPTNVSDDNNCTKRNQNKGGHIFGANSSVRLESGGANIAREKFYDDKIESHHGDAHRNAIKSSVRSNSDTNKSNHNESVNRNFPADPAARNVMNNAETLSEGFERNTQQQGSYVHPVPPSRWATSTQESLSTIGSNGNHRGTQGVAQAHQAGTAGAKSQATSWATQGVSQNSPTQTQTRTPTGNSVARETQTQTTRRDGSWSVMGGTLPVNPTLQGPPRTQAQSATQSTSSQPPPRPKVLQPATKQSATQTSVPAPAPQVPASQSTIEPAQTGASKNSTASMKPPTLQMQTTLRKLETPAPAIPCAQERPPQAELPKSRDVTEAAPFTKVSTTPHQSTTQNLTQPISSSSSGKLPAALSFQREGVRVLSSNSSTKLSSELSTPSQAMQTMRFAKVELNHREASPPAVPACTNPPLLKPQTQSSPTTAPIQPEIVPSSLQNPSPAILPPSSNASSSLVKVLPQHNQSLETKQGTGNVAYGRPTNQAPSSIIKQIRTQTTSQASHTSAQPKPATAGEKQTGAQDQRPGYVRQVMDASMEGALASHQSPDAAPKSQPVIPSAQSGIANLENPKQFFKDTSRGSQHVVTLNSNNAINEIDSGISQQQHQHQHQQYQENGISSKMSWHDTAKMNSSADNTMTLKGVPRPFGIADNQKGTQNVSLNTKTPSSAPSPSPSASQNHVPIVVHQHRPPTAPNVGSKRDIYPPRINQNRPPTAPSVAAKSSVLPPGVNGPLASCVTETLIRPESSSSNASSSSSSSSSSFASGAQPMHLHVSKIRSNNSKLVNGSIGSSSTSSAKPPLPSTSYGLRGIRKPSPSLVNMSLNSQTQNDSPTSSLSFSSSSQSPHRANGRFDFPLQSQALLSTPSTESNRVEPHTEEAAPAHASSFQQNKARGVPQRGPSPNLVERCTSPVVLPRSGSGARPSSASGPFAKVSELTSHDPPRPMIRRGSMSGPPAPLLLRHSGSTGLKSSTQNVQQRDLHPGVYTQHVSSEDPGGFVPSRGPSPRSIPSAVEIRPSRRRRAELLLLQQQDDNEENGKNLDEQFVGWRIEGDSEGEAEPALGEGFAPREENPYNDLARRLSHEEAPSTGRWTLMSPGFTGSTASSAAAEQRRLTMDSTDSYTNDLFRLPDEQLFLGGAEWNPRRRLSATSATSETHSQSRRGSVDSYPENRVGPFGAFVARRQRPGSFHTGFSSSEDEDDLGAGFALDEDAGLLLDEALDDDLFDPTDEAEFAHPQDLAKSRFDTLKSYIGQQLRDKGVSHANVSAENFLESERKRLEHRHDMTGEEVAAVALCKRAEAKAAALKDYAHELEAKLVLAHDSSIRLNERVQVLEVQRVLLGMLVGITVPAVVGAILSHHYALHELEATWLVIAAWLLGLYFLLYALFRLMQRLRTTLDEAEREEDESKVIRTSSSSSVKIPYDASSHDLPNLSKQASANSKERGLPRTSSSHSGFTVNSAPIQRPNYSHDQESRSVQPRVTRRRRRPRAPSQEIVV